MGKNSGCQTRHYSHPLPLSLGGNFPIVNYLLKNNAKAGIRLFAGFRRLLRALAQLHGEVAQDSIPCPCKELRIS
jgi:hypothetical protein